ncbi:hypothetical protein H6G45_12345 [Synechocystis sp. FACHB-383]|nr:hypothetical protein [Synechocystis sp. FACHB-383]
MKIMTWHLSNLIPTSPPLYLIGLRGLIWKAYAYFIALSLLVLITGGISFLYLFEFIYRLELNQLFGKTQTKQISSSLTNLGA